MIQHIFLKGWHLTGRSGMRSAAAAMIMGLALSTLSSCRQAENAGDTQVNIADITAETGGRANEVQETQDD